MPERRPRRLLIVSQFVPSADTVGPRRVAAMTKHLALLGYEVTVVASPISGTEDVEGAARTLRVRDLHTSRFNWRRGNVGALGGSSEKEYVGKPSLLAQIVVPDLALPTWTPFAMQAALRLATHGAVDCVITSSPPESVHLVGLALAHRGIPWIAELRDGWTYDTTHVDWPTGLQHRIDRGIERATLTRADGVVAVTEPITVDLRRRFGIDAVTITNGYDLDEQQSAVADGVLDPERFSFVHTGRMGYGNASPAGLIDALADLSRSDPELAARLELVFVGPLTADERARIDRFEGRSRVRGTGPVDRPQALAIQAAADALVVITAPGRPSIATGKLFEYLAAAKPVLVLGDETEAARIVLDAGVGAVAPREDRAAIAGAVRAVVDGGPVAGVGLARYSYPNLAAEMGRLVEAAVARRR